MRDLVWYLVNSFIRRNRVAGRQLQSCKRCGAIDRMNFHVPDATWIQVAGEEFECLVLCLACFDDLAFQRRVEYLAALENVVFAGNQECFEFQITKRRDSPKTSSESLLVTTLR